MKRLLFAGLLTLLLARPAFSRVDAVFINNGTISSPLVIDATNFINNGLFDITFNTISTTTSGTLLVNNVFSPFDFSDVLFYTNRGIMAADSGFIFDTAPSGNGSRRMAGSFGNANIGQISAGSATNSLIGSLVFFTGPGGLSLTGTPSLKIWATNIVNTGLLDVGVNGLIGITGQTVNLSRGTVHIEGLDDFSSVNTATNIIINGGVLTGTSIDFGVFDSYWAAALETNQLTVANFGVPPLGTDSSSLHKIIAFPGITGGSISVNPPNPEVFVFTNRINASNFTYQVVIVNTNIAANGISTDVRFQGGGNGFRIPVVQWSALVTNNPTLPPVTNTLYLSDSFGARTNFSLVTNGFSLTGQPELVPANYTFSRFLNGYTNFATTNTGYDGTIFNNAFSTNTPFSVTNEYTAYGVNVQPVTASPDTSSSVSTVTNVPGRVEINASQYLDLTRAKITGPNYLRLTATNHYAGSANAQLIYPFADINLGTTNGTLSVSNLVAPYVPRFEGTIDIYSARWTNIDGNGVTNEFHVMFVDAELQPTSPVVLNTFSLRSTNIYLSDLLNVTSNLLLNAQRVTITSNSCGAAIPTGELNIGSGGNIVWSTSFPVLQYLTNWGLLTVQNTVYFAGIRQNPYYTSNFTEPYQSLVNHGTITSSGVSVWANYFENTGSGPVTVTNCDGSVTNATNVAFFSSSFGPFNLQASNAILANGAISAGFVGDINITSGALSVSNHTLQSSGSLTLTVTNLLTDTGTGSSNFWSVTDGFNLPIKPTAGDLLGTTINSTCPAGLEVDNFWAGQDRGVSVTGFSNNAAIGHVILDGGDAQSTFFFNGPGGQNAIYIDLIELKNGATNRASRFINGQVVQVYTAIDVDPATTVYFADAMAGGLDISEKLNGTLTDSGGHVIWVPAYAGFFSSTNVTYPSGQTYTLNRALVQSSDIDSDGDGTVNANDTSPIFVTESIKLSLSLTNAPGKSAVISWQTLSGATNSLFTSTSLTNGNWSLVTNFVKNFNGTVSVTNSVQAGGPHYYKVRVDPVQP